MWYGVDPLAEKYLSMSPYNYCAIWLHTDRKDEFGVKYENFQIEKFNVDTQPMYCILDSLGNVIKEPVGYIKKEDFLEYITLSSSE